MTRIVYLAFPDGKVAGGQKVILRHVEALRALGFDAVVRRNPTNVMPQAYAHAAPVEVGTPFRPDDVLVVPTDAPNALAAVGTLPNRSLVFCQGHIDFMVVGRAAVMAWPKGRTPAFLAIGPTVAASLTRAWPDATVDVVPAFADERLFRPNPSDRPDRTHAVAAIPRKRPFELRAIRGFLAACHPRHAETPWALIENAPETEVARALASASVFLSLSRLEGLGLTPLEAMASGALVAGFPGVGGRDFATPDNGFWAPDDDVEAAADALAQALDVSLTAGPALARMKAAAHATAEAWSHARFVRALEDVWMRHAPDARIGNGPLD